ncbi:hypothetical protein D1B31_18945 [Neobacillus notoginsengisoli]|uniref:Uncharacterized protein n=1 Tax=Neobacillus notoginsengisoli TaxID=1578198 RepID=A0A417YQ23_9BACI|nr:hypothetical protein [Neobacillus notoginsengisoli]RHW35720.1 hypothetical protein D1B31_18945 [Neobacillus notoginsengisoli]
MNKLEFWLWALLTAALELLFAYSIFKLLLERGYLYTFRIPVHTGFMSFPLVLLFCSAVFLAITLGVFRKESNEAETLIQYFASFLKHPIPVGSLCLFTGTFLFL